MRIARLTIHNWLCFRGEHTIELGPKAYAIVARHLEDRDRSNYSGKTALAEAVRFALYGWHRHRTEDGWITQGEKEGWVHLEADDGSFVSRERARGISTQVRSTFSREKDPAAQAEAEASVVRATGLTETDFLYSRYFVQGEMARMIKADPADRMRVVSAWLELAPLERASDRVRAGVRKAADALTQANSQVSDASSVAEVSEKDLAEAKRLDDEAGAIVKKFEERMEAARARESAAETARRVESLKSELAQCTKGKPLSGIEVKRATAEAIATTASAEARLAARDLRDKRELAAGHFDGVCPVAGIQCPAKAEINSRQKQNTAIAAKAEDVHKRATDAEAKALDALKAVRAQEQEAQRASARADALKAELARLGDPEKAEAGETQAELRPKLDAARTAHREAAGHMALVSEGWRRWAEARAKLETRRTVQAAAAAELAVWRESGVVFREAARVIAAKAIGRIERGANRNLVEAGIDLSVALSWAREGQGLASVCPECGAPFPTSRKVRECASCGAERGPNVVQKFEIVPSDRSGAADDIAGVSVQLSAGEWLCEARGSSWSSVVLDEPFAQCDRANRRAFAAHLPAMLRASGADQALVIAHTSDAIDVLPGRIEIVRDGKFSSIAGVT